MRLPLHRPATVLLLGLALGCPARRPGGAEVLLATPVRGAESLTVALPRKSEMSGRIMAAYRRTPPRRVITFVPGDSTDPRDILDSGIDALLSDDPAVLDYAGTRGFTSLVLPWSTTYGLLAAAPLPLAEADSAAFREALARDAVRGEARAAAAPEWWRDATRCPAADGPAPPVGGQRSDRIVYPRSDRHARELAERLVAFAAALRAVGVTDGEFAAALRAGNDFAYVLATPSRVDAACAALARAGLDPRIAGSLTPLVETRWRLIVRPGRFGVSLDEEGTPHFR